jgi:uncharacterized protein (DUF58 family)
VDWRAYARTDALKVRLFREEISPHLDLVVDLSASMAVTPEKARALTDLVLAFEHLASRAGGHAKRLEAGGGPLDAGRPLDLSGKAAGLSAPRAPLRPRSARVLVSDFLSPDDPVPALRMLAAGAAHLDVIQLLDPWEAEPVEEGAVLLVDAEDAEARLGLRLDASAISRYRQRLARLTDGVVRATRSAGGTFARVLAADLGVMLRRDLARQGVVEPA